MLVQLCHVNCFAVMRTQHVPLCIIQLHRQSLFSSFSHAPLLCACSRAGWAWNKLNSLFLPLMMPFFPSSNKIEELRCISLHVESLGPQEQVRDPSIMMGYCVHEWSGVPYGQAPATW